MTRATNAAKYFNILLLLMILGLIPAGSASQVLLRMEVVDVPEEESIPYVVRLTDEAVLIVHSSIPQLGFESNNTILNIDRPNPGEYILHLNPGTHIIVFKADGYMVAQRRFVIDRKTYREVNVNPVGITGEKANLGAVEYRLTPGFVLVMQDGEYTGNITVRPDSILHLDGPPGRHIIKLVRLDQGVFEDTVEIEIGKTLIRDVVFRAAASDLDEMSASGVLVVKSDPDQATVYIDGVQAGTTTLQIKEISPGTHSIRLEKLLYKSLVKEIKISANSILQLDEVLLPDFATLTLKSEPSGAEFYIDDKYVGVTPHQPITLQSGEHVISLAKTNYHKSDWIFNLKAGDTIDTALVLKPAFGRLIVASEPSGADVYLDHQPIGQTPLTRNIVPSGTYVLKIEKGLYGTLETRVVIEDNKDTRIDRPLIKNFGTLVITSNPSGINIRMAGTGTELGKTPATKDLAPSTYAIIVENEDYEPYSETIAIQAGRTDTIFAGNLVRKTGVLRIFTEPIDALVYVNDSLIGHSPQIVRYPTGTYQVRTELTGYAPAGKPAVVRANSVSDVEFGLVAASGTVSSNSVPKQNTIVPKPKIVRKMDEGPREVLDLMIHFDGGIAAPAGEFASYWAQGYIGTICINFNMGNLFSIGGKFSHASFDIENPYYITDIDALTKDTTILPSIRSNEFMLDAKLNLISKKASIVVPYLSIGFGVSSMSPKDFKQTASNGTRWAVEMGVGLRLMFSQKFGIFFEGAYRNAGSADDLIRSEYTPLQGGFVYFPRGR